MKYKDENGQWQDIILEPSGDTLPIGTVVEFEGDTVPYGYEKVQENLGEVVITSTNTNPSSKLGGTWELIDKEFSRIIKYWENEAKDNPFTKTDNTSSCGVGVVRTGQEIRLRLDITPAVNLTETTINLGTLNLEKLGISALSNSILQIPCFSDGGNSIVAMSLDSNGNLQSLDVISKDGTSVHPANSLILLNTTLNTYLSAMIDNTCNKFYWKRIA